MVDVPLGEIGKLLNTELSEYFDSDESSIRQVLCLSEEVGEFVGAFRRWSGRARRSGSFQDVIDELADVIIVAAVTADVLEIDLANAIAKKVLEIRTRGYKDSR